MPNNYKRKLKKFFAKKDNNCYLNSFFRITIFTTIIIFTITLSTQIYLNYKLTPKGKQLEILNQEKNNLIENNREKSQEIAKIKSINIVEKITEAQLGLTENPDNKQILVSNESVLAVM